MSPRKINKGLPAGAAGWKDFEKNARRRLPKFAFEYLSFGIGENVCFQRNRRDLDEIVLAPKLVEESTGVDSKKIVFGQVYDSPLGVAPVGAPSIFCPEAEIALASACKKHNQPFCTATPSTTPFEALADILGPKLWFQLYPTRNKSDRIDLLGRLQEKGIETLVLTIDVPAFQWRENFARQESLAAGWRRPLALYKYPRWIIQQIKGGRLRLPNIEKYARSSRFSDGQNYIAENCIWPIGLEDLKILRDEWPGNLVIKGIANSLVVPQVCEIGVDAIYISNHGGRQLDAAPSTISVLREITGNVPKSIKVFVDGGVRSGIDVTRYLSHGADLVFAGRLPYMAISGWGPKIADPLLKLMNDQIIASMIQLGCSDLSELSTFNLHERN